ncbi:MAG: DUF1016 domain-containing protein [Endomicrobium sp.]|nr:DUF1016 domain-containing protein [Endomicrobium sp.]
MKKNLSINLLRHIEDFLLELGRDFVFVGAQQRINIGKNNYYVDMVFYNKLLKAYVLIDLKIGDMKVEYAGQMNQYLKLIIRRKLMRQIDEVKSMIWVAKIEKSMRNLV